MIKQVIVMRSDLKTADGKNIRIGKYVAQGAHASLGVFTKEMKILQPFGVVKFTFGIVRLTVDMAKWLKDGFTKVCLLCENEEHLQSLYEKAKENNLPCSIITDSGRTEFNGVPTKTCIAIGPSDEKKINKITGSLPLMK